VAGWGVVVAVAMGARERGGGRWTHRINLNLIDIS
jgi:hypothetical protein